MKALGWAGAGILFAGLIMVVGAKYDQAMRGKCDLACYPSVTYRVLEADACLCGPYTERGRPRYEVRGLDGGAL